MAALRHTRATDIAVGMPITGHPRTDPYVSTPEKVTFVARWLAYTYPCQRFVLCLTTPHA